MKSNFYILWLGALFLLLLEGMERVGFWAFAGISTAEPHGMRWMGGLFLLLLFILTQVFFKPYLAILDERDAQTFQKKEGAEVTRKKADGMIGQYKDQIDQTRLKAVSEREKRALEAEKEESKIIALARQEGSKVLATETAKMKLEADAAMMDLRSSVRIFAQDIVSQVLLEKARSGSKATKQVRATG